MFLDKNSHMDCIVDTQFELYNTKQLQSLKVCFLPFYRQLNAMWSGELSDNYTAAIYVHCNTEKETIDVNMRLN